MRGGVTRREVQPPPLRRTSRGRKGPGFKGGAAGPRRAAGASARPKKGLTNGGRRRIMRIYYPKTLTRRVRVGNFSREPQPVKRGKGNGAEHGL